MSFPCRSAGLNLRDRAKKHFSALSLKRQVSIKKKRGHRMYLVLSSCIYVYFLALTFVSCKKSDQARAKCRRSTENSALKARYHKPPHWVVFSPILGLICQFLFAGSPTRRKEQNRKRQQVAVAYILLQIV